MKTIDGHPCLILLRELHGLHPLADKILNPLSHLLRLAEHKSRVPYHIAGGGLELPSGQVDLNTMLTDPLNQRLGQLKQMKTMSSSVDVRRKES